MGEIEKPRSTIALLAIIIAFAMGLTVGSIDRTGVRSFFKGENTSETLGKINREIHSSRISAVSDYSNTETTPKETDKLTDKTTESTTARDFYVMYRTPTGKRYHFDPGCAGINRIETDYDEAVSIGLTPCKKCADG